MRLKTKKKRIIKIKRLRRLYKIAIIYEQCKHYVEFFIEQYNILFAYK